MCTAWKRLAAAVAMAWAVAAPAQEAAPAAEVVQARGDEQVRPAGEDSWRPLRVGDRLAPGAGLRTGGYGLAALVFRDETQIRVHPDSRLTVERVRGAGGGGTTVLALERGSIWARALTGVLRQVTRAVGKAPGEPVVSVRTVTATIGIRGTDWHVRAVPDGPTLLTVLDGEAELRNELGRVVVSRGEIGIAEPGRPPVKRVLIDVRDRPLMVLDFTLRWFQWLHLTPGATVDELVARWQRHAGEPAPGATPGELLAAAAAAYDQRRLAAAGELLARARAALPRGRPELEARARLLAGLLAARAGRYGEAEEELEAALAVAAGLEGRARAVAELARIGILVRQRVYDRAGRRLEALGAAAGEVPEVRLFEAVFAYFRGEPTRAREMLVAAAARFPQDPRFPALEAQLALVLGEPEAMRRAFRRALELDPRQPFALHAKGMYHQRLEPDPEAAETAYRAAVAVDPWMVEAWSNLALLYLELGEYDQAGTAVAGALEADGDDPLALARAGDVARYRDRTALAAAHYAAALAADAGHPAALLGKGVLELEAGRTEAAVATFLKAAAANPALSDVQILLGAAYYQDGRREAAVEALAKAGRLDPDNPIPDLMRSVIAQDRAQAGAAVRAARAALGKARRYGTYAVDTFASTRSGISNLGSAYASLGLADWGAYYARLAYDPYQASSPLFLAGTYPSLDAALGASNRGLLLDPLAVSAPNRYFQFLREPRDQLTLGGSVRGYEGGGSDRRGSGVAQGFLREPYPLAYRVFAEVARDDGFRRNTDSRERSLFLDVGSRRHGQRDQLLLSLSQVHATEGIPGPASDPDPDDESESDSISVALGYQRRNGYDDRVLARLSADYTRFELRNGAPLGTGLDDLDLSLVREFGLQRTRAFYAAGLYDFTAGLGFEPTDPFLVYGPNGELLCDPAVFAECRRLTADLPARVDPSPLATATTDTRGLGLQLRHLFSVGDADLTYGAEWVPAWSRNTLRQQDLDLAGFGGITDLEGGDPEVFPFLQQEGVVERRSEERTLGAMAYAQGRWETAPGVRVAAGLHARRYEEGDAVTTRLDPRLGIAWEPAPGHWLRAAAQQELVVPATGRGTLGPVTTLGLVPDDTYLATGSRVTDVKVRWDAEWSPGLYTYLEAERQEIDDFVRFIANSFDAVAGERGRIDTATVGVNLWLRERFGVFGRYRWQDSEDRGDGPDAGNGIPLVPARTADVGLTWVHPRQIRVSVTASHVGERWADSGNTRRLDDYATVSASVNWQPLRKHWSLTLAAANLLDEDFEVAAGFPAQGRSVQLAAEYRF